jgi:hypothetical protein
MTEAAPTPSDNNNNNRSNEGEESREDRRMRMRSFLYVVRHDLSRIRTDLERLLELNEEYIKSGSLDWRWRRVREHADNALRNVDKREKYIRRNLGEITDLTRRDPSLEPESLALTVIDSCRDAFGLASRITDPKFQQDERNEMVRDVSREIQRLDSEAQRLYDLIRSSNDQQ